MYPHSLNHITKSLYIVDTQAYMYMYTYTHTQNPICLHTQYSPWIRINIGTHKTLLEGYTNTKHSSLYVKIHIHTTHMCTQFSYNFIYIYVHMPLHECMYMHMIYRCLKKNTLIFRGVEHPLTDIFHWKRKEGLVVNMQNWETGYPHGF